MPPKLNYILTSAFYCFYLVGSDFQGLAYHIPLLYITSPSQLKILTLLVAVKRHRFLEHNGVAYIYFCFFFSFIFPPSFFSLLFLSSPFLFDSHFPLIPFFLSLSALLFHHSQSSLPFFSVLFFLSLLPSAFLFFLVLSFCSFFLLYLLIGPLSPFLYALSSFSLPLSVHFSILFLFSSFFISFLFFFFSSFLFFSLSFSLFHLWWTSLVQQTSAHPATHSFSQQEAEERMKNSG